MNAINAMKDHELASRRARVQAEYDTFRARGSKLDMTRGKPGPDQLSFSSDMLTLPGIALCILLEALEDEERMRLRAI